MSTSRRPVVVGVDGSPDALRAVRWGAAEAGRRDLPLRLVHAYDQAVDHVIGQPTLGDRDREIGRAQADRTLADAAAVAGESLPASSIEQDLVVGYPINVLVDESDRAALVVVGSRGRARVTELIAGSVAAALAAHGRSPVVVVRGAGPVPSTGPVVVGIDGSPASESAIAFAFEAAAARHASLVAVTAWRAPLVGSVPMDPAVPAAVQESAAEILAERLAGWGEKFPDVEVRRVVEGGAPARALAREAEHAQLLVIGSRGHGVLVGALLGSVGHALVHAAPCPVVVVRSDVPAAAR